MVQAVKCKICGITHWGIDHPWPKRAEGDDEPAPRLPPKVEAVVKRARDLVEKRSAEGDVVLDGEDGSWLERVWPDGRRERVEVEEVRLAVKREIKAAEMRRYRARKKEES